MSSLEKVCSLQEKTYMLSHRVEYWLCKYSINSMEMQISVLFTGTYFDSSTKPGNQDIIYLIIQLINLNIKLHIQIPTTTAEYSKLLSSI